MLSLSLVGSQSYFYIFIFIEQKKYLFYFYATTVNVLMGFMPLVYSHGAYCFLTFLFPF